jgi:hypothetical protein
MKNFKLLSLVGITSIALTHAGLAGGHGGDGFGRIRRIRLSQRRLR